MIIIGAGMAGLLAANYFRKHEPIVYEKQKTLPHNHEALLRFRTEGIQSITGIKTRQVVIRRGIIANNTYLDRPNPHVANAYAMKVSGRVIDRSIWNGTNADHRFIPPTNFVELLARGVDIIYDTGLQFHDVTGNMKLQGLRAPIISTIPMPVLMSILDWKEKPNFSWKPIWVISASITFPVCDVQQTLYFSDLDNPVYRASITGNRLSIELNADPGTDAGTIFNATLENFGIPSSLAQTPGWKVSKQEFGKIVPIDENVRRGFMYQVTRDYNIYSLGRFATWRQILLDDLCKDLQQIERMIMADSAYNQRLMSIAKQGSIQ